MPDSPLSKKYVTISTYGVICAISLKYEAVQNDAYTYRRALCITECSVLLHKSESNIATELCMFRKLIFFSHQ